MIRNEPAELPGRKLRRPSPLVSTPPSERLPHPIGPPKQAMSRRDRRAQRSNAGQANPSASGARHRAISVCIVIKACGTRGGERGAPRRQRHPHRCRAGGGRARPLAGAATRYGRPLPPGACVHSSSSTAGATPPPPPAASPTRPSPRHRPPTADGGGLETGDRPPWRCPSPPHAAPRRAAPSPARGRAEAARGGGGGGGGGSGGRQTPRGFAPPTRGRDRQTAAAAGGGWGGVRLRGMRVWSPGDGASGRRQPQRLPQRQVHQLRGSGASESQCQARVCGASRGRQISCALLQNRPSNWMVHGSADVPLAEERQQGSFAPGPGSGRDELLRSGCELILLK